MARKVVIVNKMCSEKCEAELASEVYFGNK